MSSQPAADLAASVEAESNLFVIDRAGQPDAGGEVLYDRELIVIGEEPEAEYDGRWDVEGPACFNCGEPGHTFRECPKPRDRAAIQAARDATRRYTDVKHHGDEPLLPPAGMSDELLAALGCKRADPLPWAPAAQRFGCPPAYYFGGLWPPPRRIHCDLSAPLATAAADDAATGGSSGAADGGAAAATAPSSAVDASAAPACPAPVLPVPPSQAVLGRYANNGDLSRVVALFDAGYHPLPPGLTRATTAVGGAATASGDGEGSAGLRIIICSDDDDDDDDDDSGDGTNGASGHVNVEDTVPSDAAHAIAVASGVGAVAVVGRGSDAALGAPPMPVPDHVAHPATGLTDCQLLRGLRLAPAFPVCGHAGGGGAC